MNEQIDRADTATEAFPQAVRAVLEQRACALPVEIPPIDALRRRGRRRRAMRDALTGVGALALVGGAALGVSTFSGMAASGAGQSVGPATSVHGGATPSAVPGVPQGQHEAIAALKHWKSGPKFEVPTYTAVPAWISPSDRYDAASQLSTEAAKGHPINQPVDAPGHDGCLSFGSSPLVWPTGFYAEGTPLTVFDPHGHAVYVLNEGFTGADGNAELGEGNGTTNNSESGFSLTGCPSADQDVASTSVFMIFNG